jgi:hypothetical protein
MFKKYFKTYFKNISGATAVEFAIILPILILLLSGMYEFSMYVLLNNKMTRVSGTVSFLASRAGLTEVSLSALMNAADVIAKPFDFNRNGGIVISQIGRGQTGGMTIAWQKKVGSGTSRIGIIGGTPINLPHNIQIKPGQNLIIAESFYNYTPFIFNYYTFNSVIYKVITFTPRQGSVDLDQN